MVKGVLALLHSRWAGRAVLAVLVLGAFYLVGPRGMRNFLVPSSSMEPTLHVGDYMVTLRARTYERGDIVVIREGGPGDYMVKRIVAVGGDTVQVIDGALYVNGRYASEPYIREPMRYLVAEPRTVPPGEVFLLGDNRNNSDDSASEQRSYPLEDVVGRVRFIYYPYARFGPVPQYPLTAMLEAAPGPGG